MSEEEHGGTWRAGGFGPRRQMQLLTDGLAGRKQGQPFTVDGLREAARERLPTSSFDYLDGAAGTEDTLRANSEAFRRHRIVPRMLRGSEDRDLSVRVLGRTLPTPILTAPMGALTVLHEEGELAVARAAAGYRIPVVLSTVSSYSMEEVAETCGKADRWFQLYWSGNKELTASLIGRAEKAGFSAIVVTVDAALLSWRPRDIGKGYHPQLHGDGLANYFSDPVFRALLDEPPERDPARAVRQFAESFGDVSLRWDDLSFLIECTDLPILLKGILHPDDARLAIDHGASGIIVSNHGGRQVDGSVAALDALSDVAAAVGAKTDVLFDSGIRSGADVVKALALGARAVLVGRPYGYGLAVRGEAGVRDVLGNLLADFDLTLGLAGCRAAREVDRSLLREIS